MAALRPRCDMVGLHFFDVEMLAALGADALLSFVDLALGVVVEGSDVQIPLIAIEDVGINATFFCTSLSAIKLATFASKALASSVCSPKRA